MENLSHFKSEAATKAESETRGVQLQPLHQIPLYPTHWTFHTNVRSWDWMWSRYYHWVSLSLSPPPRRSCSPMCICWLVCQRDYTKTMQWISVKRGWTFASSTVDNLGRSDCKLKSTLIFNWGGGAQVHILLSVYNVLSVNQAGRVITNHPYQQQVGWQGWNT